MLLCAACGGSSGGDDGFTATIPFDTRYQYYVCPNFGKAGECYMLDTVSPRSEHAELFLAQHPDFFDFRKPACVNDNETTAYIKNGSCNYYDVTVRTNGLWWENYPDASATIPAVTRYQYHVCPDHEYGGSCYSIESIVPDSEYAIHFLAQHPDFFEFRRNACPNNVQTSLDISGGACSRYDVTVNPDGTWINTGTSGGTVEIGNLQLTGMGGELTYAEKDFEAAILNKEGGSVKSKSCMISDVGESVSINMHLRTNYPPKDVYTLSCSRTYTDLVCESESIPLSKLGAGVKTKCTLENGGRIDVVNKLNWNDPQAADLQLTPITGSVGPLGGDFRASVVNTAEHETTVDKCVLSDIAGTTEVKLMKSESSSVSHEKYDTHCQRAGSSISCNDIILPFTGTTDSFKTKCTLKSGLVIEASGTIDW